MMSPAPDAVRAGYSRGMVRYRRNFVAGGTYFFTATLVDRKSSVLIAHVEALRVDIRVTRRAHPMRVLPDHLDFISLPAGDADDPNPWQLIKRRLTYAVAKMGAPIARHRMENSRCGSVDSGSIPSAMREISSDTSATAASIPLKHGLVARVRDWPHSSFHHYARRGLSGAK